MNAPATDGNGSKGGRTDGVPASKQVHTRSITPRPPRVLMAVRDARFADGTTVHLSVSPPWWSWLYLGLVYQPTEGSVSASRNLDSIVLEAMGLSITGPLAQVTPQGSQSCTNCFNLSHYFHNFGFPAPPWLGGGGFSGVGFRATVSKGNETKVLHDHWGSEGDTTGTGFRLPADFA
jgi:hypothetical protein